MTKVVYVTGCLGFIGSYVTRDCLKRGWYVRGIDKCTYAANTKYLDEFNSYPNFTFEKRDIRNLPFLYGCDYVINTAAETHVDNSIVDHIEFMRSNIDGVRNLLELIRNYRAERSLFPTLIHFSTDEVYGDIEEGCHYESDLLKPSNPYSATKAAADMLILAWARTYNIPYVIVRPTNNYGVGQYIEKLIPKSIKYLTLGRKIPLHNNGSPFRNWLHASDTSQAVQTIIDNQVRNEIFNICGGFEQQNVTTVKKIIELFDSNCSPTGDDYKQHIDFSCSRPGQDVRYAIDDSKLRTLNWKPKANFDEELVGIVDFYRKNFLW